ncbi:conserved Plasmodium protein, unknown function [Plasmodium knowlesi strain H]|uniref:Uncharacterized protein n=1 Tax=Plasmodium knowlesi (strain H) TaxID=5851 RepID=A0A1A7VHL8_PLAKH|nr:conserved Plasmodium protein, unknown function [Plasmodium knowlesi strain H]SBO21870.1 conserved Plasmodium protein, unknown function [Plasmodium knowlesi strain H]
MKNRLKRTYIYIKSNLNNISSIASIICLLDCVLIPVITVVISIFDVAKGSDHGHDHHDHDHDHHYGWHEIVEKVPSLVEPPCVHLRQCIHVYIQLYSTAHLFLFLPVFQVALYVMTPIISFTTIYNFIQLKNISLFLMTLVGITLFVLTHAHIQVPNQNVMNFLRKMHIPLAILAAIFLIGTNRAAHKLLKSKNLDRCCKHKKITNNFDKHSCTEHQSCDHHHHHHHDHHDHHHHHHHHHQDDLEMNEDNYDMHNNKGKNDNSASFERYYHIGFQQNGDQELVRFL